LDAALELLMRRCGAWASRNPHRGQLARPMQLRQAGGVPPIRPDPVARPLRDQRRCHDNAIVSARRQLTARSCLITEPQLYPPLAELATQPVQRRRRVGSAAVVPNLAAQAVLR